MNITDIESHTKKSISELNSLKSKLMGFIDIFESVQVEGCQKSDDSDMLLFEWGGPYIWEDSVVISLVRQFTLKDDEGEYSGMKQLQLNCCYPPNTKIGDSGNKWLEGENIEEFKQLVLNSDAYMTLNNEKMTKVIVTIDDV